MSLLPSVALVGRPNVGKSRMFNRIVGKRIAIVHDQAGVTRDLATAEVDDHFVLMDTGGIGMMPEMTTQEIFDATEEQVDFAIQAASLVLFVVDGPEGCTAIDQNLAEKLRRYNKKTLLVANKMENDGDLSKLDEFYQLGFGRAIGVSAEHGKYFTELGDAIEKEIGPKPPVAEGPKLETIDRVRICLAGRPNVGKSSLANCLLKSERMIVSEVAGTTRDAVETDLDYTSKDGETSAFRLVDTAGVKPNRKLGSSLDYFSNLRTEGAINSSDVAFLVLDARTGVTKHDKKLAGDILEEGIGLVIVVNKWDYIKESFMRDPIPGYENEREFRLDFVKGIRKQLFFLPDSPIIFTSAKENFAVEEILVKARLVAQNMVTKLPTGPLNRVITNLFERKAPRVMQGKRLKIYYSVQIGYKPIRIKMFSNTEKQLDDQYRRYLQSGFFDKFDLIGCPIRFELVGKPKKTDVRESKVDPRAKNSLTKHGKAREVNETTRQRKRQKQKKQRAPGAKRPRK